MVMAPMQSAVMSLRPAHGPLAGPTAPNASALEVPPALLRLAAPQTTPAPTQPAPVAKDASPAPMARPEATEAMQLAGWQSARVWTAGQTARSVTALAVQRARRQWLSLAAGCKQRQAMAPRCIAQLGRDAVLVPTVQLEEMARTAFALTRLMAVPRLALLQEIAGPTLFHLDNRLQIAQLLPFRWVEHTKVPVRQRMDAHMWLKSPVVLQNVAIMLRVRISRFRGLATGVRVTSDTA